MTTTNNNNAQQQLNVKPATNTQTANNNMT